jgi:hypothetical protein
VFNLSNILLVAAIDIAGVAVAFPVGVGLALVLGVITTYWATRAGNVPMLSAGVTAILLAIILDAIAYRRLVRTSRQLPTKGLMLSIVAGALMGWFYSFVAHAIASVDPITGTLRPGKLSPYTAIVSFSLGRQHSPLTGRCDPRPPSSCAGQGSADATRDAIGNGRRGCAARLIERRPGGPQSRSRAEATP